MPSRLTKLVDRGRLVASTARHLRPVQWVYWPLRRLQQRLPPPARPRDTGALSADVDALRRAVIAFGPGDAAARLASADAVRGSRFRFLGHEEWMPSIDWTRRHVSHLWSYNLHYFDYALDLAWATRLRRDPADAARLAELIDGWIVGAPYGTGVGWEPYALSVRTVNWSYALLLADHVLPPAIVQRAWRSVYEQLAFLQRRQERHLLANHLQRNLRALFLGGLVFGGARGTRWRRRAGAALWRELFEQVLPDGTHYERAPMYHASALGDFLESLALARAARATPPDEPRVVARLARMHGALHRLSRPDGTLHLFNDSADGIAPTVAHLDALAEQLLGDAARRDVRTGAWSLSDGGYFGWRDDTCGERFVIDCGELAPPYQPGHAHCDLLSFELDLDGRRVVVDSGVSGYEGDPLRAYSRSTRAHNTVDVAGREQSQVWGTFRVGRRARVVHASVTVDCPFTFEGAYRPYWSARTTHRRLVRREPGAAVPHWTVEDRLEGAAHGQPAISYIHLHPSLDVVEASATRVTARWPDGDTIVIEPRGVSSVAVRRAQRDPDQGWYCPAFGVALPSAVIELTRAPGAETSGPFGYSIYYVTRPETAG